MSEKHTLDEMDGDIRKEKSMKMGMSIKSIKWEFNENCEEQIKIEIPAAANLQADTDQGVINLTQLAIPLVSLPNLLDALGFKQEKPE